VHTVIIVVPLEFWQYWAQWHSSRQGKSTLWISGRHIVEGD